MSKVFKIQQEQVSVEGAYQMLTDFKETLNTHTTEQFHSNSAAILHFSLSFRSYSAF
jgi:hypothetical protein